MQILAHYQCLCDATRLRILNLLLEGPLCVCHVSAILDESQPNVSRHLKVLKQGGAVHTERHYNWTVCTLPARPAPWLKANLRCLQDQRAGEKQLRDDLKKRARVLKQITCGPEDTLPPKMQRFVGRKTARKTAKGKPATIRGPNPARRTRTTQSFSTLRKNGPQHRQPKNP